MISLEQDIVIYHESDFHKNYGDYIDRHTACGEEEDDRFNAMQDTYLNNLVVKGIAIAKDNPKKGPSSFQLTAYGRIIYQVLFDEEYFCKEKKGN